MFMGSIPSYFSPPEPENDFDTQLLSQIESVGWYNLHVAEGSENSAFAFLVGHFQN